MRRTTIKARLIKSFSAVILIPSLTTAVVAVLMIRFQVMAQAQARVTSDLEAAREICDTSLASLKDKVRIHATRAVLYGALDSTKSQGLAEEMGLEEGAMSPQDWMAVLEEFWRSGRGLFSKSGAKGKLSRNLAQVLVLSLSRELADVLAGRSRTSLGHLLAQRLDLHGLRRFDLLLAAAQEALVGQVSPSLTIEWLATRVSLWVR